jgi:hypothetical protein
MIQYRNGKICSKIVAGAEGVVVSYYNYIGRIKLYRDVELPHTYSEKFLHDAKTGKCFKDSNYDIVDYNEDMISCALFYA